MRGLLRHDRAAAALVLALAVLVYLAPLLAGRQMSNGYLLYDYPPWQALRPAGIETARNSDLDLADQFYPLTELARHQLDQGHAPLWNPSSYAGTPLLGDVQTALLYPLTWLALLTSFPVALGWICALKLLTAAFGTYVLARELRIRAGPALVAALVYALSAPMIGWLQTPLATVTSLMPWLILATERLRRSPSPARAAVLGAVVALSVLAGHPETAALSSAAAGVYLLAALAAERGGRALRSVAAWIGAHALGLGVSAVVVVPFLSALGGSVTAQVHHGQSSLHLPLSSGLVLFMPNVFGDGPGYRGPLFFYLSSMGYFGVAAILPTAVGAWRGRAEPFVWGLVASATVALMVIFAVPPIRWLVPHLPPFSSSINVRVFHVVALAGAVLAAAGLDSLSSRPLALRRVVLALGGLLALVGAWFLVQQLRGALPSSGATKAHALGKFVLFAALGALLLALAGRARSRAVMLVAAVVVVLDLGYLHDFNALLPPAQAYPPKPPVVGFLQSRPSPFRISPVKPTAASPNVFLPNTPALYGLEAPQGYDYPQSARWSRFATRVLGEVGKPTPEFPSPTYARPFGPARTGLRLMNVRYYVAPPATPAPGPGLTRVYAGRDATVYQDAGAMPRAYVVPRTVRLDDRRTLDLLARGALDPRRAAAVPPDAPATGVPTAASAAFRPLDARRLDPTHWRIAVPPGTHGWLVLADSFSNDWRGKVDGRDVKLYPTDYAATGLALRAGARTVDIELDRSRVHAGAAISLASLGAIAALIATGLAARRRRARPG